MTTKNNPYFAGWFALCTAWVIALIATLGALFIGEVMGKTPCLLCWYQRIFMFPLALILGVAVFREDVAIWLYGLPLAVFGWFIAAYHSLLFFDVVPKPITPCSQTGPSCSGAEMTIWGGVPLPLLSLIAFTLITVLLFISRRRFHHE